MLYHLVVAVAGMGILMVAWFLFQGYVRRHTPDIAPDGDVLEGRWGCSGDGCPMHEIRPGEEQTAHAALH